MDATGYADLSIYDPKGHFDGSAWARRYRDVIEVGGRRQNFHDFDVIEFGLKQSPGEASAYYTVRTPIAQPDVTIRFDEPSLTLLLLRHPETLPMLNAVLAGVGADEYHFADFALAQADAEHYVPAPGTAAKVAEQLGRLTARDWHQREAAVKVLASFECALFCQIKLDMTALDVEQRRGVNEALSFWPILSADECATLRRMKR